MPSFLFVSTYDQVSSCCLCSLSLHHYFSQTSSLPSKELTLSALKEADKRVATLESGPGTSDVDVIIGCYLGDYSSWDNVELWMLM